MNSAKVMALLNQWNMASHDQCRYCWCLPTCNVGCFANVGEGEMVTPEAKLKACAINRSRTHDLLIEYCGVLEENPKAFDYMAEMTLK